MLEYLKQNQTRIVRDYNGKTEYIPKNPASSDPEFDLLMK